MLKTRNIFLLLAILAIHITISAQKNDYQTITGHEQMKKFENSKFHDVQYYSYAQTRKKLSPKNVILFIGDGMGLSHLFAALVANNGHLYIENLKYIGFSKTQSSDDFITDSGAGGTALATGQKTYNGAIGVDTTGKPLKNLVELAESKGLSTGLVSTSSITHATPASFIAHQSSRSKEEDIARDFLKTDIDVFIGGGLKYFKDNSAGNLLDSLKSKGYSVLTDINEIEKKASGKLAGLTADDGNPRLEERGEMLPRSTKTAIHLLSHNKKGFFLMVEGSQIDWGAHQNNTVYLTEEVLDMDKAVGKALEFAATNKETLIIVTADHETGAMSIKDGDFKRGSVSADFNSKSHTGIMVPVFAFGPGAENFCGIYENTEIFRKIKLLLGL